VLSESTQRVPPALRALILSGLQPLKLVPIQAKLALLKLLLLLRQLPLYACRQILLHNNNNRYVTHAKLTAHSNLW
jgi:hypothetical protein